MCKTKQKYPNNQRQTYILDLEYDTYSNQIHTYSLLLTLPDKSIHAVLSSENFVSPSEQGKRQ